MIESTPIVVDSIVLVVRMVLKLGNAPKESYEKMGLQSGYALPRMQFDYMMFKRGQEIIRENAGSQYTFSVHEIILKRKTEFIKLKVSKVALRKEPVMMN